MRRFKYSCSGRLSPLAVLVLLALSSCSLLGDEPDGPGPIPYEIETLLEWDRSLRPVAFSPDGARILFQGDAEDGSKHVYVMDRDGSNVRRLTDTPGERDPVAFSPDGTQVLYSEWSSRGWAPGGMPAKDLYVVNVDGTGRRLVVGGTGSERHEAVAFTPGGDQIVYWTWYGYDVGSRAHIANVDGTNQRRLTELRAIATDISPDGSHVLLSHSDAGNQISIVDSEGENLTQLTESGTNIQPFFANGGQRIVYSKFGDGIVTMNMDGTDQMHVTSGRPDVAVDISPDSQRILLYSAKVEGFCPFCSVDNVYVLNTDGSNRTEIRDGDLRIRPIAFSPDGRQILLRSDNVLLVDDEEDRRFYIQVAELKD